MKVGHNDLILAYEKYVTPNIIMKIAIFDPRVFIWTTWNLSSQECYILNIIHFGAAVFYAPGPGPYVTEGTIHLKKNLNTLVHMMSQVKYLCF